MHFSKPARIFTAISSFFTERGIYPSGYSGLPWTDIMPVGGGTTGAFNLILQFLVDDVRKENNWRQKNGVDLIKPAILMPVPTYGFFQEAAMALGIKIYPVARDLKAGGTLNPDDVLKAIRAGHKEGLRFISFFDSNPNNPTGLVRGEKETKELGRIFKALNDHYERSAEDQSHPDDKQLTLDMFEGIDRFLSRRHHLWEGPASRMRIIDDMVYDGLEYGDQKPFSFAQISELYKDCFVLFGTSKAGLANMRGGLVIGDSDKLHELNHRRMMNEYFPSQVSLHALEAYFNTAEPFAEKRRRHLDRMNQEHRFRGLLMKALINGMDTMPEVELGDRTRMINAVMKETGKTKEQARNLLTKGVPGVNILTTPQSGFFHLVDFSALKGRVYDNYYTHHKRYSGVTEVEDGYAIGHVFTTLLQLHMANGNWMGLENNAMIGRLTYAMPVAEIIDLAARLDKGVKLFEKPKVWKAAEAVSTLAP